MILRSPLEFGKKDSAKALAAARKLQRHRRIWEKAHDIMRAVDPQFAGRYTAIAVTHTARESARSPRSRWATAPASSATSLATRHVTARRKPKAGGA